MIPDLALGVLQLELHLLPELEVQRAERLVEEQYVRLVDDRPGQCHALPLPAGKLGWLAVIQTGQPHHVERALRPRAPLGLGDALDPQAVLDVLPDRHVREQRVVLEDGIDVTRVWRHPGDLTAAELDYAGVGLSRSRRSAAAAWSCPNLTVLAM